MGVGGVGSITSMNNMASLQTTIAGSTDVKSKNIQNEIDETKQLVQKISSRQELSADEKADEKKELQKELSRLNMELERYQEEFLQAQKREAMMVELRKEAKPAEEEEVTAAGNVLAEKAGQEEAVENDAKTADAGAVEKFQEEKTEALQTETSARQAIRTGVIIFQDNDGKVILKDTIERNESPSVEEMGQKQGIEDGEETEKEENKEEAAETGLSQNQIYGMVSANTSLQQAGRQETVIARIGGESAVLKGEIKLDENRGDDTERKREELDKLKEKRGQCKDISIFCFREANGTMKSSAAENARMRADGGDNAIINAAKLAQDAQQQFYVSVG